MGIIYNTLDAQSGLYGYPKRVVYKYAFSLTHEVQYIRVKGRRPQIVHCAFDTKTEHTPCIWIEHDESDDDVTTDLYVKVFATGEVLPTFSSHIATLELGGFYWHVYTVRV